MKRFLLFGFDDYYPYGGMKDFIMDFDTMNEVVACTTKDHLGDGGIYIAEDGCKYGYDTLQAYDQQCRKRYSISEIHPL